MYLQIKQNVSLLYKQPKMVLRYQIDRDERIKDMKEIYNIGENTEIKGFINQML